MARPRGRAMSIALAEAGATSTFFVVGQVAVTHPELVRDIAAAGHEVGCHSWDHRRVHRFTPEAFRDDLRRAIDALEQAAVAGRGEFSSPRIAAPYLRVLRDGFWFTAERGTLDADADAVQHQVSGVVRLTLFDGACAVGDVQVAPSPRTIVLAKATD